MNKNPVKVIRDYCLYCCNGSAAEVRNCHITKCILYAWRFGKNPFKVFTEEQRKKLRERLTKSKNPHSIGEKTAQKGNIEPISESELVLMGDLENE